MKRFILAVIFVGIASLALAQSALQPIAEVTVYRREPITLGQVKNRITAVEKELGRQLPLDGRKQVMNAFIDEKLFAGVAAKEGIVVTDAEVNQYFNQMLSQQLGRPATEAEFANYIKDSQGISLDEFMKQQNGMTMAQYKQFLKEQLSTQRYVAQKKAKELQSIKGPSDNEIRSYYDLNKQSFFKPDTVKLFLVSVPKGTNPARAKERVGEFEKQLKKSKAKAMASIKTQANSPTAGFAAGEIYLGKTPTTAEELGLTMEALLAIFNLDVNAVSDINETAHDYQCFMVLEKDHAKVLALSDLADPNSTVTLYEYIKNMLTLKMQQDMLQKAIKEISAEIKTPANYKMLVSDAQLEKLLSW